MWYFSFTIRDFFSGSEEIAGVGGYFEAIFGTRGKGEDGLGLAGRFPTVFEATGLGVMLPPRPFLGIVLLPMAFVGETFVWRGERAEGVFALEFGNFLLGATVFRLSFSVSDGARCRLRELFKVPELS